MQTNKKREIKELKEAAEEAKKAKKRTDKVEKWRKNRQHLDNENKGIQLFKVRKSLFKKMSIFCMIKSGIC